MSNTTLQFIFGSDEYMDYIKAKIQGDLSPYGINIDQINNMDEDEKKKLLRKHKLDIMQVIANISEEIYTDKSLSSLSESGIIEK